MNRFRQSILFLTGALALALTAWAQSSPATNRPSPPAPPRADAPGAPINPNQTAPQPTPAAAPDAPAAAAQPRELNFAEADVDGDKRISLTEYASFVESRMASRSTEAISEETIQRFRQLDQDNDAYLSEAEARGTSQPPSLTPGNPRR